MKWAEMLVKQRSLNAVLRLQFQRRVNFSFSRDPQGNYDYLVSSSKIADDPIQRGAVKLLQNLFVDLVSASSQPKDSKPTISLPSSLFNFFQVSKPAKNIAPTTVKKRSLYLWGGTGSGKTFLMDLFHSSLLEYQKNNATFNTKSRRVHFHDFMLDVHRRIHELKHNTAQSSSSSGGGREVLKMVSDQILSESDVICFDELQVTDIADAMVLRTLFEHLFKGTISLHRLLSTDQVHDLQAVWCWWPLPIVLLLIFIRMVSITAYPLNTALSTQWDLKARPAAVSLPPIHLSPAAAGRRLLLLSSVRV